MEKATTFLCYWDYRGLAEPIRMLLEHTGTKYEDHRLSRGPPPEYDRTSWTELRRTVGLDFPNLPFLIDGDLKITQSNAILRFIARRHGLLGQTEEERVRVDILSEQLMDLRNGLARLCYNQNFDRIKGEYLSAVIGKLRELERFLGDRTWFAGESLTFVDFVAFELLDQHRELEADVVRMFAKLLSFMDRFEELPNVAEYLSSDRFLKTPLYNQMARFGSKRKSTL